MKAIDAAKPTDNQETKELELCISCLKTNTPGTHFCNHCGTPLTSYAATAPFESILAEGDMWRKATGNRRWGPLVKCLIIAFLVLLLLSILLGIVLPR